MSICMYHVLRYHIPTPNFENVIVLAKRGKICEFLVYSKYFCSWAIVI